MDNEQLYELATQLDADADAVVERWQGRPDLIIDDIFRVRDIDTGKVRDLELFDVQRKFVHAYFYSDAGTINAYKGRRIGYSFVAVACFVLEALFYPSSYYPLVSRSLSQAKDRISDIQNLIDHARIEIPCNKENTDYIELWNESAFQAYSAESDTSRGADSARAVLMDEMAFMENEERAQRAFGAFLALGQDRKMVEVSTPNTRNDVFMKHQRRGSADGDNGILSIKQPTFENADDIDINKPLTEQEVIPVRPELNIQQIETERMADPEGFGQEYLCRPVVDAYRFFSEDAVLRAQEKAETDEYRYGINAPKPSNIQRVAGVDIGINRDDTAISVMDHHSGGVRHQKALFVVDDDLLRRAGVQNPDRGNANHIAKLLAFLKREMDIDLFILDKGGPGETFQRIVERRLGRNVVPFDFSAKDEVNEMFGDTNIALREGNVVLVPRDRLYDEMCAIVKEKRDQYAKPKFSGKDNSESGKDDTAMATVLSAFPPYHSADPKTEPRKRAKNESYDPPSASVKETDEERNGHYNPSFGATSVTRQSRSRSTKYQTKRKRRRRR